jgi:hypothetical protein
MVPSLRFPVQRYFDFEPLNPNPSNLLGEKFNVKCNA